MQTTSTKVQHHTTDKCTIIKSLSDQAPLTRISLFELARYSTFYTALSTIGFFNNELFSPKREKRTPAKDSSRITISVVSFVTEFHQNTMRGGEEYNVEWILLFYNMEYLIYYDFISKDHRIHCDPFTRGRNLDQKSRRKNVQVSNLNYIGIFDHTRIDQD